ncbi:MAG: hypothetical protein QG656_633, partial [Candidatus Hydrogenedentes bacterium]|nr:hypothetical protein [Candidatus Hydrogenedentota bacterium]
MGFRMYSIRMTMVLACLTAMALNAQGDDAVTGRPVRVVSIGFADGKSVAEICA